MKKRQRVIFCTYPCVYSSIVLNSLIELQNVDIVGVIKSSRNLKPKEPPVLSNLQRITHSGTLYVLYLWLISQGHSIFAKWTEIPNLHQITKLRGIPSHSTKNINSPELKEHINNLRPDIIICAHFNQLISPEIYSLAKVASLNIHPSLLPDLKGVDPAFYALLEEYNHTGTSLHYLAEVFDTGKVISNTPIEIEKSDSLFSLNIKLFKAGADLLRDFFNQVPSNKYSSVDNEKHRYDSWPKASEIASLSRKGRKLFTTKDIKSLLLKTEDRS